MSNHTEGAIRGSKAPACQGLCLYAVVLNSLGIMVGIGHPAALELGKEIFAAPLLSFAMQYYYLIALLGGFP